MFAALLRLLRLSPSSVTALSNSLPSTQIEIIKLEECGLDDAALQEFLFSILMAKNLGHHVLGTVVV